MEEILTFKGSRPWPWLGSGHTAYRHASVIDLYQHTKFHCGWMDGQTEVQI